MGTTQDTGKKKSGPVGSLKDGKHSAFVGFCKVIVQAWIVLKRQGALPSVLAATHCYQGAKKLTAITLCAVYKRVEPTTCLIS